MPQRATPSSLPYLSLGLAQRLLERISQVPQALHICLQLMHAVVLHTPPLQRRINSCCGCRWHCGTDAGLRRHVESEGGLCSKRALEASAAVVAADHGLQQSDM